MSLHSTLARLKSKEKYAKDVGEYQEGIPAQYPLSLESCEQQILQQIEEAIGDKSCSEAKLQFAPGWIIDKSIEREKKNYKESVEVFHRSNLPRKANIGSSHLFFTVMFDGKAGNLRLRCRVVPHEDKLRSDSSPAQFPVKRTVLSMAAIHRLKLATLDISKAYLQSDDVQRDIYIRPNPGGNRLAEDCGSL